MAVEQAQLPGVRHGRGTAGAPGGPRSSRRWPAMASGGSEAARDLTGVGTGRGRAVGRRSSSRAGRPPAGRGGRDAVASGPGTLPAVGGRTPPAAPVRGATAQPASTRCRHRPACHRGSRRVPAALDGRRRSAAPEGAGQAGGWRTPHSVVAAVGDVQAAAGDGDARRVRNRAPRPRPPTAAAPGTGPWPGRSRTSGRPGRAGGGCRQGRGPRCRGSITPPRLPSALVEARAVGWALSRCPSRRRP